MKFKQILVIPILFTLTALERIVYNLSEITWDRVQDITELIDDLRKWSKK